MNQLDILQMLMTGVPSIENGQFINIIAAVVFNPSHIAPGITMAFFYNLGVFIGNRQDTAKIVAVEVAVSKTVTYKKEYPCAKSNICLPAKLIKYFLVIKKPRQMPRFLFFQKSDITSIPDRKYYNLLP